MSLIALTLVASPAFSQEIPANQVPSVVLNSFQQTFSKASDIEWEKGVEGYSVEFETGMFGTDHEAWFDKTGKLVKHKEEISKKDLPKAVMATLNQDFKGYRIDDPKKITEGSKVIYTLELKSFTKDWNIAIDTKGKVIHQMLDD